MKESKFTCKFLTVRREISKRRRSHGFLLGREYQKRMQWFQELTCAKDSEIKMSLITKEKQATKLKLEAATKLRRFKRWRRVGGKGEESQSQSQGFGGEDEIDA